MHQPPDGPAFDIVLILHVACVVAGLATVATSGVVAARLARLLSDSAPLPESVVRYFRPGVNWAGRSVYGIPLFGFLLLTLSHGAYSLRDGWVTAGLGIFVLMVLVTEGVLWPAERRLQGSLLTLSAATPAEDSVRDARAMSRSATVAIVLLLVGSVLMVAQP
jgi:Predicted integral membrane protein (DUF2269)